MGQLHHGPTEDLHSVLAAVNEQAFTWHPELGASPEWHWKNGGAVTEATEEALRHLVWASLVSIDRPDRRPFYADRLARITSRGTERLGQWNAADVERGRQAVAA